MGIATKAVIAGNEAFGSTERLKAIKRFFGEKSESFDAVVVKVPDHRGRWF